MGRTTSATMMNSCVYPFVVRMATRDYCKAYLKEYGIGTVNAYAEECAVHDRG